jgi:hypothetical protein
MAETPLPPLRTLFAIALGVRLLVVGLGSLLANLPPDPYLDPLTPTRFRQEMRASSARVIEPWYRFDALWMVNIARHGYAEAEDAGGKLGVAFMPVLPALMAASEALGVNLFWLGIVATNLAGAAGTAVCARVALRLTGEASTARRTFVLVLAFPASMFLSAPYNDAFGLLFTALALDAWLAGKAPRAGAFALLGSLARLTGIAMGVAALVGWVLDDRSRGGFKRAFWLAAGSFAGLALFWGYLGLVVGDPLAGLKSQTAWGRRELALENLWYAIESIYDPDVPRWGEALTVLAFAALGIRAWLKRGTFWGVLILAPIAQMMLSGTFLSGHRLIIAALPGFIELADLLRKRCFYLLVVMGFSIGQLVLANRYVHWIFAG